MVLVEPIETPKEIGELGQGKTLAVPQPSPARADEVIE